MNTLNYWGRRKMMKKVYKEYRVTNVFLLVNFVALLFSCEKNNIDKINVDKLSTGHNIKIFPIPNAPQRWVPDRDNDGWRFDRTITLSGTISVTYNGQQVPNVSITAWTPDGYGYKDPLIGGTSLSSPANGASWSITMEVPDSAKTVYFNVSGDNKNVYDFSDETLFYRQYLSPVSVYNQGKSGIVLNLGDMTNYGKEDYDGDIDDYTRAIQIDPNNAFAYHNRGFAYYNKGEHDLAIADYTQAIRIDPNNAGTYNNRGAAYNNKREYYLAIAALDQAIQLNPDFANPYRHRAFAYIKKGNYRQARADVNKALQINPKYQSVQELSAELQRLGY
jgi:hypothetical protein